MSRRTLSWSSALRDLKADRASRPAVREERLRSGPHRNLSAWRGRSGRRYVVGVHTDLSLDDVGPAVVLAVARDAAGIATLLSAYVNEGMDCVLPHGTTELHVHRLTATDEDRAAMVADLAPMTVADVLDGMLAIYAEPGLWSRNGVGDLEAVLYRVIGDPDAPGVGSLMAGVFEACGVELMEFNDACRRQEVVVAVLQIGRAYLERLDGHATDASHPTSSRGISR